MKHTGDGIMAAFDNAASAVNCARSIQQSFGAFNLASKEKLKVRVGLDAGEPVADSNDLFGSTVQMAARLCQCAEPEMIVVSETVHSLVSDQMALRDLGERTLKGFAHPVRIYEAPWN